MRKVDLDRYRRRAYRRKKRNWELSPQRRHELNQLKQYYADLNRNDYDPDSEIAIIGDRLNQRPRASSRFH